MKHQNNMKKKSQADRLIQSCYYKLRTPSVNSSHSNPLLELNFSQSGSLKRGGSAHYEKQQYHDHTKTLINWRPQEQIFKNQLIRSRKLVGANNPEVVIIEKTNRNMLDKIKNYAQCLKVERFKMLKSKQIDNSSTLISFIKPELNKRLKFSNLMNNNLQENNFNIKRRSENNDKKTKRNITMQNNSIFKNFPNKTEWNRRRDFNSEPNLISFRGWDYSPRDTESDHNFSFVRNNIK